MIVSLKQIRVDLETTLKQIRVVSVFYFSFISHVRASEIKLKQICFISVFTALHVMQTRYCDENSVRPSVSPSVCPSVTRVYRDKTVERSVQIYIPYERSFSLVF